MGAPGPGALVLANGCCFSRGFSGGKSSGMKKPEAEAKAVSKNLLKFALFQVDDCQVERYDRTCSFPLQSDPYNLLRKPE